MSSPLFVPTYELFFILESFQACFAEYVSALRPLADGLGLELLGCDVYYREDTDVALLALRFDERELDAERLSWILDFAGGAGLAALDPAMLPDEDRRRFYQRYLEEYPMRAENRDTPENALHSVAENLGLRVPNPRRLTPRVVRTPSRSDSARRRAAKRDQSRTDQMPTVERAASPPLSPATSRLETEPLPDQFPDGSPPSPLPAIPVVETPDRKRMSTDATATWRAPRLGTPPRSAAAAPSERRRSTPPPTPPPKPPEVPITVQPAPAPQPINDAPTAPSKPPHMTPTPRRYPRASSSPVGKVRLGSNRDDGESVARPARVGNRPPGVTGTPNADTEPARISVRFRRGDDWVPARLRSLGLKGAYLACGAPPRLHDDVHVALGLGPVGTVMRGTVVHVTTADDATASGTSGFGVLFPTIDSPSRRQLKELLQHARQRGVVLEPPPPRAAVRFPVRWPVHVILPNQTGVDMSALDLSTRGMFISTLDRLPAGALEFFMPTEHGGSPIHGRIKCVREVPWKMAAARGLHSGFGMQIVSFHRADDLRYQEFIARIGRRVQRRIAIGASAERAEVLAAGLTAAGYTCTATSDPNTMIKLAECDPRPPDAALIDGSLQLQSQVGHRIERLLAMREVPMISIDGEAPYRARAMVDGLLSINIPEV